MAFTEPLSLATLGASLGSIETLVTQLATITQTQFSAEEGKRTSISDTPIGVAAGIEDSEDTIDDPASAQARV